VSAADVQKQAPTQPRAPVPLSNALFPELPASSAGRQKTNMSGNQSMKNILGDTTSVASVWTSGTVGTAAREPGDEEQSSVNAVEVGSGKSKKKGKQKQTLFTLGTFPT